MHADDMSIAELEAELARRIKADRQIVLSGKLQFEFAGLSRAQDWSDRALDKLSGIGTLMVGPAIVHDSDDGVLAIIPYVYRAVSASRHDIARFCVQVMGEVLEDAGRRRLHPLGWEYTCEVIQP